MTSRYEVTLVFYCNLCQTTRRIQATLREGNHLGHAVDSDGKNQTECSVFLTPDHSEKEIRQYLLQRHNNHFHEGKIFDGTIINMGN